MKKEARVLFFDIESLPLKARIWQPGKQFVGYKNLLPGFEMWDLICIQYAWEGDADVKVLRYDKDGGTKGMIEKFDKLIREADFCIGKNSDKFDVKMLNSLRMMHGLPGIPEWPDYCDDLEKQMRKYFRLPSQSLDYISRMLGIGGKDRMEMQDWIDIQDYRELEELKEKGIKGKELNTVSKHMFNKKPVDIRRAGKTALDKMCKYGAKDTHDTILIWEYCKNHFKPKFNRGLYYGHDIACSSCGSEKLIKQGGAKYTGKTKYQYFRCKDCDYTKTRCPVSKTGILGRSGN